MKRKLLLVLKAAGFTALPLFQNCFNSHPTFRHFTSYQFKNISFLVLLLTTFGSLQAQTGSLSGSGGRFAGFNIDADTKTGYNKIAPAGAYMYDDDWFKSSGAFTPNPALGKGIFDVSDSASLRTMLQANLNSSFTKRMSGQPYDISVFVKSYSPWDIDTNFLVDGVYFRDYYGTDKTAYTTACKNGQSPNLWQGGTSSVNDKADIIDVYTHVRTTGLNPAKDSAWFFAGVATKGTNGSRYFDIEVYREKISFTPSASGTGTNFVSAGTSYGHSKWELNSAGNVTRTGDIIISVSYSSGSAPEIDFRIWIAKSTYDSIRAGRLVPQTFKLNGNWDVADDNLHGYAEITGEVAGEIWGSGLGNYTSGTANTDSTYSTPWGTVNTSGAWSQNYDQLQYVEVGLNFSRFGMNPFQYVTSYCTSPYSSIMVKSRASTAFSANLIDFVGPIDFTIKNAADFTVAPEIFSCTNTSPKLNFNFSARNYYRLLNSNGDTLAKDIDFRTAATAADRYLAVTQPGTYRVEATNFQGCPSLSTTTITVEADTSSPVAKTFVGYDKPFYYLNGVGEGTASSTLAASPSTALTYSWIGPDGFSSTEEDPAIGATKADIKEGAYTLTVREARNGCTASSMIQVYVGTLTQNGIQLQGKVVNNKAQLYWNNPDVTTALLFEIERSINGGPFVKAGQLKGAIGSKTFSFTDAIEITGTIQYRIKTKGAANALAYSNTVSFQNEMKEALSVYRQGFSNQLTVRFNRAFEKDIQIKIISLSGNLLLEETYPANQQNSRINASFQLGLPPTAANQPVIVALYEGATLVEAKKL